MFVFGKKCNWIIKIWQFKEFFFIFYKKKKKEANNFDPFGSESIIS